MQNFDRLLPLILSHEGGYINHPQDSGGPTNRGVTLGAYRRYIKRDGSIEDLKTLTPAQAGKVFKDRYWDAVRADELPAGIDYSMGDFAINSGPVRAIKEMQKLVGVVADGKLGSKTMAAIHSHDPVRLVAALNDARLVFMRNSKNGKNWKVFGVGWQARVDGVRYKSLDMLSPIIFGTPEAHPVEYDPADSGNRPTGWAAFIAAVLAIFGGKK